MSNRGRGNKLISRRESVREVKVVKGEEKSRLSFSFKDLDETQPEGAPQTLELWHEHEMLTTLIEKIRDVSELSRDEAVKQQIIKCYGDFPPADKTDFTHPGHVEKTVSWSVLRRIGGQKGTVAGYLVDNVFHVVFLDMDHKFWISELKHT